MADTYKGESASKSFARLLYWKRVSDGMGDDFRRRRHIALASRVGGDFAVLEAHKLGHLAILVDREEEAVEAVKQRYPSADVRHSDVVQVVEAEAMSAASVFLDFCAPITSETVRTCARVMDTMSQATVADGKQRVVGVALLKGRERDDCHPLHGVSTRSRRLRRADKASLRRVLRQNDASTEESQRIMAVWGAANSGPSSRFRANGTIRAAGRSQVKADLGAVRHAVLSSLVGSVLGYQPAFPLYIINYVSNTRDRKGVPMSIGVYPVVSIDGRKNGLSTIVDPIASTHITDVDVDDSELREYLIVHPEMHAALNVSRGRVSAWRAHATRGTYVERRGSE